MRSDDALLGQPATVEAAAEIDNPDLTCRITPIAGGPTETLPMVPDLADARRAMLVLDRPGAGDYRLAVSGPTTNTVTGVLSVVDPDA